MYRKTDLPPPPVFPSCLPHLAPKCLDLGLATLAVQIEPGTPAANTTKYICS